MGKRRTLQITKDSHSKAERVQSVHGITPTGLVRNAVAASPRLKDLAQFLPPAMVPVSVDLTEEQCRQVEGMTKEARKCGYKVSQADLLRAYLDYQLKQLNGGVPPGG